MSKLLEFTRLFFLAIYKNLGNIAHYVFIVWIFDKVLLYDWDFYQFVGVARLNYVWFSLAMLLFFIYRVYTDEKKIK